MVFQLPVSALFFQFSWHFSAWECMANCWISKDDPEHGRHFRPTFPQEMMEEEMYIRRRHTRVGNRWGSDSHQLVWDCERRIQMLPGSGISVFDGVGSKWCRFHASLSHLFLPMPSFWDSVQIKFSQSREKGTLAYTWKLEADIWYQTLTAAFGYPIVIAKFRKSGRSIDYCAHQLK